MRKKPATVCFIGDQSHYVLGCGLGIPQQGLLLSYLYCRDCPQQDCGKDKSKLPVAFIHGNMYEAYLLDLWEAEWEALSVRDETGEIQHYCQLSDFRVVNDPDEVVSVHNAKVKCIVGDAGSGWGLVEDQVYECIGYSWQDALVYYVADGTGGTYPYLAARFKIIDDPYGTLDEQMGTEVFWWDYPECNAANQS